MRRLRSFVLMMLVLGVAGTVAWALTADLVVERARRFIEEALSHELRVPVRVQALRVSVAPLVAVLDGFEIGDGGAAVRVAHGTVRVRPWRTVAQGRLVGEIEASDVWVAPAAIPSPPRTAGEKAKPFVFPFPFQVVRAHVAGATVAAPVDGEPLLITAAEVEGSFEVSRFRRWMSVDAGATDIHLRRAGADVALRTAQLHGGQTAGGIEVSACEAIGDGINVKGGRTVTAPRLTHALHADLPADWLRIFGPELRVFNGRMQVEGTLEGSLGNPDVDARLRMDRLGIGDMEIEEVRVDVTRRGRVIEVPSASGRVFKGELAAHGRLTIEGPVPFELAAEYRDVEAQSVAGTLLRNLLQPASVRGILALSGSLEPLSLSGQAGGEVAPRAGGELASWQGRGTYSDRSAEAELLADQGPRNHLRGTLGWSEDGALTGDLGLHAGDMSALRALLVPLSAPSVTGVLDAAAVVNGKLEQPKFSGRVNGVDVGVYGIVVNRLDGAFAASEGRLRSDELRLSVAGGEVDAAGDVALTADGESEWRVKIAEFPGDAITTIVGETTGMELPLWRGTLSGEVAGRGSWLRPGLEGALVLRGFRLGTEPFDSARVEAVVEWPKWRGTAQVVHRDGETLDASGEGQGDQDVTVSLRSTEWQLDRLRRASLAEFRGAASLEAELRGPLAALSGSAWIGARDLTWSGRRFGDSMVTATAENGMWLIDGSVLDRRVLLDGRVTTGLEWPFAVTMRWTDAELGSLLAADPTLRLMSSGTITANGPLRNLRAVDGDVRIDSLVLEHGEYRLQSVPPAHIHGEAGRFRIESLVLEGNDGGRLQATGGWSTAGDVDVSVEGEGDLAAAELLTRKVKSARGRFRIGAAIARSGIGDLRLSGDASMDGAALDVGLPVVLTDTNARISLADTQVRIDHISGQVGGGTFDLGGSIDVRAGPDVTWAVTEINTGVVDWLEHEVSGRGWVRGAWNDITIGGDVDVLKVLYEKRIGLTDFLPWFQRRLARPPDRQPLTRILRLDLHVSAPSDVFIDNNFAKMELRADMRVAGTVDDVQLSGPIEVVSGQVMFRDRTFEVTSGVVEFRRELGLNPALNINTETVVRTTDASYTVMVQVVGTAEDYRVLMTCDDATLSQNDIVSLITVGKTSTQAQQSGAGMAGADVLALGAGAYEDNVERGVKELLPIDRIRIEPAFSRATGAFEPRVTIGKDFTENLTAMVASSFGVESFRTVQLEYRLLPTVALVGSWESQTRQEEGAFGGGIKFHREFRSLPCWSLLRNCPAGEERRAEAR